MAMPLSIVKVYINYNMFTLTDLDNAVRYINTMFYYYVELPGIGCIKLQA